MNNLNSPHFVRKEFACRCGCGADTVDAALLKVLEQVRTHFGQPVYITSGHRCSSHNKKCGGSENSQHLLGKAADIQVKSASPTKVADYLEAIYPNSCGIGRYDSWVHIDVRDHPARWG